MPDARHHDFARVDVVRFRFRGIHLQLTHRRSARRGADVQAVSAVWCRISGLQQLPDRDGRTYMMPGRIIPRMEIGRAACRERVCKYVEISVVAVSLKKKRKREKEKEKGKKKKKYEKKKVINKHRQREEHKIANMKIKKR